MSIDRRHDPLTSLRRPHRQRRERCSFRSRMLPSSPGAPQGSARSEVSTNSRPEKRIDDTYRRVELGQQQTKLRQTDVLDELWGHVGNNLGDTVSGDTPLADDTSAALRVLSHEALDTGGDDPQSREIIVLEDLLDGVIGDVDRSKGCALVVTDQQVVAFKCFVKLEPVATR